ncbi:hypothetical protein [Streptomyces collinus]|uniref:hypothetical protein n=1 Tax=Streptomyces collinus TaxID=42684 RepID=UPI003403C308
MFRGRTARSLLFLFAATLIALPLFAIDGTFAPAHTLSEARAKAQAAPVAEQVCKPGHAPANVPHTHDRRRGRACGPATERPLIPRQSAAPRAADAAGAPHHRTTRTSRARSTAALQVFRC